MRAEQQIATAGKAIQPFTRTIVEPRHPRLENSSATLQYQLKDKVAMVSTASASNIGGGDAGMAVAKIVATNSADLGLVMLPTKPRP